MRNLGLISGQTQLDSSERVSSIEQALAANSEKAKGAVPTRLRRPIAALDQLADIIDSGANSNGITNVTKL